MATANVAQALRTKEYETIYILRSDIDAETVERVQHRVAEVVDREAGKLVKVEAWGRRKLAYPVGKQKKGVYVYVKFLGKGGLVQELERNLKLQDAVIKYQTVLLRENVDAGTVTVDPEEVKTLKIELPAEAEEVESREKALGLVDLGPDAPRSMRAPREDMGEEEFGGEGESGAPRDAAEEKKDGEEGEGA